MTLYKQLRKYLPISSETAVLEVMEVLRARHSYIDTHLDLFLSNNTNPDVYDFLNSEMEKYRTAYIKEQRELSSNRIIMPQKKKKRPKIKSKHVSIKRGGLSESDPIRKGMFSFRSNTSESLSSQGYEYGLSDW